MAAFTTALLVGLAAGGAFGAGKAVGGKGKAPVTPGPSSAQTTIAAPPPAPPSTIATASAGVKAGQQAAATQRKRAGGISIRKPIDPMRRGIGSGTPVTEAKTLIGGGY